MLFVTVYPNKGWNNEGLQLKAKRVYGSCFS